jgi:hypothetical protein
MSALQRPGTGVREPRPRLVHTVVVAVLAAMVAFAGLAVIAGPATAADTAADTDVVTVPDPAWKAYLNNAVATAKAETRTPDQDITVADALRVTTLSSPPVANRTAISDFTGVEAFTNINNVNVSGPNASTGNQSTVSDLSPFAGLTGITSFQLQNFPVVTDLGPLASMLSLKTLNITGSGVSDVSPVTSLPQLSNLIATSSKVSDLSQLAPLKNASQFAGLTLASNQVVDISPLAGFKYLTTINLSNNRIEDVSVFQTFDSSYAVYTTAGSVVNLSGNHIRDLSAAPYQPSATTKPTLTVTKQTVYVGPYAAGGVTVGLKGRTGQTATVTASLGSYNTSTGVLTSVDPAAASLAVSPNWTAYFSEDPTKLADLRINEVESNGDARGDWVELYNPNPTAVDLTGVIVSDNDNTHQVTFPAGTTIPGDGYRAIVTDDASVSGYFGLGGADSARVFPPGATDLAAANPIDSYSWTEHAATTYGRDVPGAGSWETTDQGTFEAENVFPPPTVVPTVVVTGDATSITGSATLTATLTKPDSADVATDATGQVVFAVDGVDRSGPVAVTNGTAQWTATGLAGSPSGTTHQVVARYVSAGEADPYDDSTRSASFTVTVTIGEFAGTPALSTTTPQYCDTVTSSVSGISPAPDQVSYQWQRFSSFGSEYVNIAGSTGASQSMYTVTGSTVGVEFMPYRLLVTASKAGYAPKTFSLTTAAPAPGTWGPESRSAAVLSTTTPRVGETVTATHSAWATCFPAGLDYQVGYHYTWLRDGQPISGATDSVGYGIGAAGPKQVSYAVTPEDAGHRVSLQIDAETIGFEGVFRSVSDPSSAVAKGDFSAAPAPVIDRTSPKLGDTLTASTSAWSPTAAHAYEWLRDGAPISGATGASYATVPADVDHAISARVTGTAAGYQAESRTSTPTAKVAAGAFAQAPAPVLDNASPKVGDTLTATVAAWSPVAVHRYQWLRDGQPIAGATGTTYPTVAADADHAISVRLTGSALGYATLERTSAATAAVATDVAKPTTVSRSAAVKVTALKGRRLQVHVSVPGLPASALPRTVTVQVAGAKGSFQLRLKNGVGVLELTGAKAKKVKTGKKAQVAVVVKPFSSTSGSTVYAVAKTTKKVKVKVRP